MYSENLQSIRSGLTNFIGTLIKHSPFKGSSKRHDTVAILIEEVLTIGKKDDGQIDLYAVKPLFKGVIFILKQRHEVIKKDLKSSKFDPGVAKSLQQKGLKYEQMIELLEQFITNIKKEEE